MMKKVFITYSNERFAQSRNRICREAKALGLFDKVIAYVPEDLPSYIQSSPLMAYERGGGYWIWKPYILWKTIHQYTDAIVVYADAGSSLQASEEWEVWFSEMEKYKVLLPQYRDGVDYGWEKKLGCGSPKIKHWTKKTTLDYFSGLFENEEWKEENKCFAGFVMARNGSALIEEWMKLGLFHPELFCDPIGSEINDQYSFYAVHRYDQSVLSILSFYFRSKSGEVKLYPETCELESNGTAVRTTRIAFQKSETKKTKLIRLIKRLIGSRTYDRLHGKGTNYHHIRI
ncbi:MAG: hypothetical protein K6D57_04115 [Paludibacteraceae bacterium]|nr:hypothetical protein [Paludibacteraceae bacterium]